MTNEELGRLLKSGDIPLMAGAQTPPSPSSSPAPQSAAEAIAQYLPSQGAAANTAQEADAINKIASNYKPGETFPYGGKSYVVDQNGKPQLAATASSAQMPTDKPRNASDTRPGPSGEMWIPTPDLQSWQTASRPFSAEATHTVQIGGMDYVAKTSPLTFQTVFQGPPDANGNPTWTEDYTKAAGKANPTAIEPKTVNLSTGLTVQEKWDPSQNNGTGAWVYNSGVDDKGNNTWSTNVSDAKDINQQIAKGSGSPYPQVATTGQQVAATLPADVAQKSADAAKAAADAKVAVRGTLSVTLDQISQMIKSGQMSVEDGLNEMENQKQIANKNYVDANSRLAAINTWQGQQVDQATRMAQNATTFMSGVQTQMNDAAQHGASAAGPWANAMLASGPALMKSFGGGPVDLKNPMDVMGINSSTGLSGSFMQQQAAVQPVTQQHQNEIRALIGTTNPTTNQPYSAPEAVLAVAKKYGIDTSNSPLNGLAGNGPAANTQPGTQPGWGGVTPDFTTAPTGPTVYPSGSAAVNGPATATAPSPAEDTGGGNSSGRT